MEEVASLISEFGFPVVMSLGMGYFIYFVWKFVTEELEPKIDKQRTVLIKLIDQMRMLDQDQIRLEKKLQTVLDLKARQHEKNNSNR